MNFVRAGVCCFNKSGLAGAYGIARRCLTGSQAAIIMYHRIGVNKHEWSQPALSLPAFERHLAHLRRYFQVIPLQELAERVRQRELPDRYAVITVDDGYKDFYQHAYPLLRKYNLPATIFVTAGHIDSDELFRWDKIRYYITYSRRTAIELPGVGTININGQMQKQQACEFLIKKIEELDGRQSQSLIQQLREEVGVAEPNGVARELILDWKEVSRMATGGIEIGAHTMTHPILTKIPLQEAEQEITLSKKEIENRLQRPVLSFAYPNGIYDSDIKSVVRRSGFKSAVIIGERLVSCQDNPYELPRFAGFENYDLLKMHLAGCITDIRKVNFLSNIFGLD